MKCKIIILSSLLRFSLTVNLRSVLLEERERENIYIFEVLLTLSPLESKFHVVLVGTPGPHILHTSTQVKW